MGQTDTQISRIRQELRNRGIVQADLARLSGVSESHISRILRGERRPSADILFRLMAVFTEGGDNE